MKVNRSVRRRLRLQHVTAAVLFLLVIGLLGWLSTRYHWQADWSASGKNTLSIASIELLRQMDGPVRIDAFARDSELTPARKVVAELIGRYRHHKPDIELRFLNPDTAPDQMRDAGIRMDGELVLYYQGRKERVQRLGEQQITNALQRLLRGAEHRIMFVSGHSERSPRSRHPQDLGVWGQQLQSKGMAVEILNLADTAVIPEDTTVLVIASPGSNYLPGEIRLLRNYVETGGNLLWLAEPDLLFGLEPLAEQLGILFLPGTIVDPTGQTLGLDNAAFAVVATYPRHLITAGFRSVTLFPVARAMELEPPEGWSATPLLETVARSWSETGSLISGSVRFDQAEDVAGPLTIGYAMSRPLPDEQVEMAREQRIMVIGDGDFLSNSFLGSGGNLDLAMNIINWLTRDEALIAIPAKVAPDTRLELSPLAGKIIGLTFLLVIPSILLGCGVTIWWRRRRRC